MADDTVILSGGWKRQIVTKCVEEIFKQFNRHTFNEELHQILSDINAMLPHKNRHTGIRYKNDVYVPYKLERLNVNLYYMTPTGLEFEKFAALLDKKQEYELLSAKVNNYLTNGFAICRDANDMCQAFPHSIVELIKRVANDDLLWPFMAKPPEQEKFKRFAAKNDAIINGIMTQLAYNIIAPGTHHVSNQVL